MIAIFKKYILRDQRKTAITPFHTSWSHCRLVLSYRFDNVFCKMSAILFHPVCVKTLPISLPLWWIIWYLLWVPSTKLIISSRNLSVIFTAMLCWRIFQPALWSNWSGFHISGGSDIHYSVMTLHSHHDTCLYGMPDWRATFWITLLLWRLKFSGKKWINTLVS